MPPPGAEGGAGDDDGDDGIIGGLAPAAPLDIPPDEVGGTWQDGLDGCKILYREYINAKTFELYQNYKVKCLRHANCYKTKGRTPHNIARFGEHGIVAALHAWLHFEDVPDKTHAQVRPKKADAVRYLSTRAEEVEVLFDQLTGTP